MKNPYPELSSFLKKYNSIVAEAQSKAIFVRALEFQKEQIEILESLLQDIKREKKKAQQKKNNQKANFILCLELSVNAVINELTFITKIKEENPGDAWDALIAAQNQISLAIRNHPFNVTI